MNKALITGAAGFIGSNLCQFLLDKKMTVFAVDNFLTGNKKNLEPLINNPHFHFFAADVLDFDFFKLGKIDYVFHLASPASPVKYRAYPIETLMVNSMGTKKILDYLLKNNTASFVFASTSEVYGNPKEHPQKETYYGNVNPIGDRACYDEGKRFAETLIITYFRRFKLNLRVARIFNTYGPNMEEDDGRVICNFIYQALSNQPITVYGKGEQTRSFCYISDMINGLYLMAKTKNLAGEVINLGNPEEKKIIEVAQLIKKLTLTKSPIIFKPNYPDDPEKRKPDIKKAERLIKWRPKIRLEDGLQKTIIYFKKRYFSL
ncbi:MAG: GDP-mannose 4,6-dehydratase [Microgenomates group bacterium]|nr:GDP-mannose 4,6-dehydratase [Microgenomates group bacterium]